MTTQEENVKKAIDEAKEKDLTSKEEINKESSKEKEEVKEEGKISDKKKKTKKIDKKDEMIDRLKAQIDELKDIDLRRMAEFENFRKRSDKEKSHMYTLGAKDIIEKILPILDNFERGFKDVKNEDDPFVKGMEMIYKQFLNTLDEMGVKEIETQDKEFDPNLHNAVMHEDNPDLGENVIVETLQKGYTYKDEVVRYAFVKVAN